MTTTPAQHPRRLTATGLAVAATVTSAAWLVATAPPSPATTSTPAAAGHRGDAGGRSVCAAARTSHRYVAPTAAGASATGPAGTVRSATTTSSNRPHHRPHHKPHHKPHHQPPAPTTGS